MLGLHDTVIYLVLMDTSLEEVDGEFRKFSDQLRPKYGIYIEQVIGSIF
jgi:hypothetical protein